MKKKAILAAAMALALMVSPFSGMTAAAEESNTPQKYILNAPRKAEFSDKIYSCSFNWTLDRTTGGPMSWHVRVYKDGELFKDYDSFRDDSNPWRFVSSRNPNDPNPATQMYVSDNVKEALIGGTDVCHWNLPFSQDLEESGTYYFEVWAELFRGSGSNTIIELESDFDVSEEIEYIRPDEELGTTVGYWDAEQPYLFHYTSVEGAAGYQFVLYRLDEENDQWNPSVTLANSADEYNSIGHLSVFSKITADSGTDAGGQDRTRDFADTFGEGNARYIGSGKYAVTVKALSNNLDEVANGPEGEKSDVFEFTRISDSDDEDDSDNDSGSGQPADTALPENQIAAAKPGEVIQITKEQNITTLSNADMKELLARGDVALEMEYTYEGVDYKIRIPAGAAMDNDIPWYGPLYLAQHYRVGNSYVSASGKAAIIVKAGDTLSKIAKANNMTLNQLKAKNPQITDVDRIMPGQNIIVE
ncbi:MAG: LysM peptidoglycan-binding domain-containing protein [Bacteroidales bacterium]|nr:LysM peptidoglycan-binding domain-containing protein [Lachnoclostridium sp.]MCM1385605.1 LysM peptidoglycan-binding domain-containing protein [Lachnoclostridium sp.]MCM1466324.1 LysM peptidoglycan-binding domain-containing protein [Bacteroidales bacterium]